MSDLDAKRDAKRDEIAAAIAQGLGLGALSSLGTEDRAEIERRTRGAIEAAPADATEADTRLDRLVAEYRDLAALRADTANAKLAEEGEVFAPEDDA